ncbi:hypothetical protein ENUP19_0374G0033, partial [Entamoeba nuttalli]
EMKKIVKYQCILYSCSDEDIENSISENETKLLLYNHVVFHVGVDKTKKINAKYQQIISEEKECIKIYK